MATTVTEQSVTISGGVLTLSGPGLYKVTIEGAAPDEVTEFVGIAARELFTLTPATGADLFIVRHNNGLGVNLQEPGDFQTVNVLDSITLRGLGSNSVKEEYRTRFA